MGWNDQLNGNRDGAVEDLLALLRIPSVSALTRHEGDVRAAAEWVRARIEKAGIEKAEILETASHPVVYGEWLGAKDKPTVLIYGHFDVQPADPENLWTHPPFDPVIRDGRVYARGATDDKGNMLAPILAIEALLRAEGRLPLNVKLFFEGQEEIGSPDLAPLLAREKKRLACDLVLSADGGQWSETEPCLLTGLRGLAALQIDVKGPDRDLHSGMYGGAVQNPIHALVHILETLHDRDGKITVEEFHDGVIPLTAEDRAESARIPFEEKTYREEIGVAALFGEKGYTPAEQTSARPTLEINGIWGGFQGDGTKTVLPSLAHAKITCRLVPDQEPAAVLEAIARHVARVTPPGVTAEVKKMEGNSRAYLVPGDHPGNRAAADVLREMYGREPYVARMGGSIPVCNLFRENLGVSTISFGFGLMDENLHSPDEFFRLASFEKAQVGWCRFLERVAREEPGALRG